jgi:membrane-bound serine protease (ClpP class)
VVLLLVEVFVTPGFGVAGIAGLIMVVASLAVALIGNVGFSFPSGPSVSAAIMTLAITMALLVVLAFSLGRYLPRSSRFGRLVLAPELSSAAGFTSADSHDELVGRTGIALTLLRPSGAARIDGERVDVTTGGEFIEAQSAIQVVDVRGSRVEVRQIRVLENDETSST